MKHIFLFLFLGFTLSVTAQFKARDLHTEYLTKMDYMNSFDHMNALQSRFSLKNEINGDENISEEHWDSERVNPYHENEVPFEHNIVLGDYALPVKTADIINSDYGYRWKRMHKGVDLKAHFGDTVYAAFDGKVRLTKFERSGYGFYIVIRHFNSTETVYGHLSRFLVKPNQYVKAGEPIALAGNSGRSTGPHLHFEIRYMGYAINPNAIFDFKNLCIRQKQYKFTKSGYQKPKS